MKSRRPRQNREFHREIASGVLPLTRIRRTLDREVGQEGRSELRPEELVRDLVVELHLGGLDEGAEGLGAAFGLSEALRE